MQLCVDGVVRCFVVANGLLLLFAVVVFCCCELLSLIVVIHVVYECFCCW